MFDISDSQIEELAAKNYLDDDCHPSLEAYKQVFLSPSADFSPLAIAVEKHGRDCPVCGERYRKAAEELFSNGCNKDATKT